MSKRQGVLGMVISLVVVGLVLVTTSGCDSAGAGGSGSADANWVPVLSDDFETDNLDTIWSIVNVAGIQEWYRYTYNANTFAKMSGWSGGAVANEDWLINSDPLDLGSYTSAILSFNNTLGFQTQPNKLISLLISTDYDGTASPPDSTFTWTDITDLAVWSTGDWGNAFSGNIDLSSYTGETSVYIAFRYISTDTVTEEWQIDNLLVSAAE